LLEAVVQELVELHPVDVTVDGVKHSRWSRILCDYGRIHRLVTDNPSIEASTKLQLPDINHTVLREW
jgi:hypothetical protein